MAIDKSTVDDYRESLRLLEQIGENHRKLSVLAEEYTKGMKTGVIFQVENLKNLKLIAEANSRLLEQYARKDDLTKEERESLAGIYSDNENILKTLEETVRAKEGYVSQTVKALHTLRELSSAMGELFDALGASNDELKFMIRNMQSLTRIAGSVMAGDIAGAVAGGISLIADIIDHIAKANEEMEKSAKEVERAYDGQLEKLKPITRELEYHRAELERINQVIRFISLSYDDDLQMLKDTNSLLEQQKKTQEEIAKSEFDKLLALEAQLANMAKPLAMGVKTKEMEDLEKRIADAQAAYARAQAEAYAFGKQIEDNQYIIDRFEAIRGLEYLESEFRVLKESGEDITGNVQAQIEYLETLLAMEEDSIKQNEFKVRILRLQKELQEDIVSEKQKELDLLNRLRYLEQAGLFDKENIYQIAKATRALRATGMTDIQTAQALTGMGVTEMQKSLNIGVINIEINEAEEDTKRELENQLGNIFAGF
jgi:hypothetical protein